MDLKINKTYYLFTAKVCSEMLFKAASMHNTIWNWDSLLFDGLNLTQHSLELNINIVFMPKIHVEANLTIV